MIRRSFIPVLSVLAAGLLSSTATAFAAVGFVDGPTEMHAGPDYDYPTVSVIDDDSRVEIYGCLEDWSWCDVSYYDDRGWISGDHLASIYEGERRPISYVAPYIGLGILAFSFDTYWDRYYPGRPWYGDRGRWFSYSREHHRASWEGHHGEWSGDHDHPDHDHPGDRDHHDDHDRHDHDRPGDAPHGQNHGVSFGGRTPENPAGHMDHNPAGPHGHQAEAQQHGIERPHQQDRGASPQAHNESRAAPRQPPQVQRQAEHHPQQAPGHQGGEHPGEGHHGDHGGDHDDHKN